MPVKPILEIEINDAAFRRFYELFEQYAAEVKDMPAAWQSVGDAMGESGKALEGGAMSAKEALALAAAQAGVVAEAISEASKAQGTLEQKTHATTSKMNALGKSVKGIAGTITSIGGWILKIGAMGGIGAIFSGLGFGDLVDQAFSRYRSAGRLGVSTGLLASFQANAQQFLGTSALESAAAAQNTLQSIPWLRALGISYRRALGMNPADLAFTELRHAAEAYRRNPAIFSNTPAGIAYTQHLGGNLGDVRNAALHMRALRIAQERTRADQSALNIDQQAARAMIAFKIALDKAGFKIQTALINNLASLAPVLQRITIDVTNFIVGFVKSKTFNATLHELEVNLQGMVKFLEQVDWKKIGGEIQAFAKMVGWLIPSKKQTGKQKPVKLEESDVDYWLKGGWLGSLLHVPKRLQNELLFNVGNPFGPASGMAANWMAHAITGGRGPWSYSNFNPLNIEAGSRFGVQFYKKYKSLEQGIEANARLLWRYPKIFGDSTIAEIIPRWHGSGPNNARDIARAERWSHVNRNLPMKDWTNAQFAAVFSAMAREEEPHYPSAAQVFKALFEHAQHHKPVHHAAPVQKEKSTRHAPARAPVHVSVTNATSARVAVSINATAFT